MKEDNNINKFLNLFNLKKYNDKIYDNFNYEVGNINSEKDSILLNANTNYGKLKANYDSDKIFHFEVNDENNKLYGYCYLPNNEINESLIKLNLLVNNKKTYELILNSQEKIFLLDITSEDKHDIFEINTENVNKNYHNLDGYITHYQESGKLNYETRRYECEKFTRIVDSTNEEDYKIETETDKNGKRETYHIVYTEKNPDLFTQKGFLMQSIDNEIYDEIKNLREYLNRNNNSLLDNSIKLILKDYNNYELFALLGVDFNNEFVLEDEIYKSYMNEIMTKKIKFGSKK